MESDLPSLGTPLRSPTRRESQRRSKRLSGVKKDYREDQYRHLESLLADANAVTAPLLSSAAPKPDSRAVSLPPQEIGTLDAAVSTTKPIFTGFPLETPPPAKAQKDALWRRKRSALPQTAQQSIAAHKQALDAGLNTRKLESLTEESALRERTKPSQNASQPPRRTHTTLKRKVVVQPSGRGSKRVRRAHSTGLKTGAYGRKETLPSRKNEDNNEEFCLCCGEPGSFLCCEGCPKLFHFLCLDPPLDEAELPEGDWFCDQCTYKMAKESGSLVRPKGVFAPLLMNLMKTNPTRFQLPKSVRERYQGVRIDSCGAYQDEDLKDPPEVQKGVLQQLEPVKTIDKNGNPLFCYKCGAKGGPGKEFAKCDYCSLVWHLDCISPPLTAAKMHGTKWRCPNHIDDILPKRRLVTNPVIVDVPVRGFTSEGDDVIISEDENYMGVTETPEGFKAVFPREMTKAIPQNDRKSRDIEVLYRVREKGVLMDFLGKVREDRAREIQQFNEKVDGALKKVEKGDAACLRGLIGLGGGLDRSRGFSRFVEELLKSANCEEDEDYIKSEELEEDTKELRALSQLMKKVDRTRLKEFLENELKSNGKKEERSET